MTEREKMIKIIDKWAERTITTRVWGAGVYDPYNAAELADALIAAGIGDVTEWKERAEKHRVIALPGGRIKQLYSDEEVEQIVKERDSKEEAYNKCYFDYRYWKDKAKEYKHRAEVAERAFDNTMKAFYEVLSVLFPDTKIDLDEWKKNNLANAEKELAEEG